MDHVSRISQSDTVTAAMTLDDDPRAFIGLVTGPIALQFKQYLDLGRHSGPRSFHAPKRQVMAGRRQSAACVTDHEDIEAIRQRGQHREGNTCFGQQAGH